MLQGVPVAPIVSAALFDDILSLILLAMLKAVIKTGEIPGTGAIFVLLGKVLGFFFLTSIIGNFILPFLNMVFAKFKTEEFEISALIMGSLFFALLAEWLESRSNSSRGEVSVFSSSHHGIGDDIHYTDCYAIDAWIKGKARTN